MTSIPATITAPETDTARVGPDAASLALIRAATRAALDAPDVELVTDRAAKALLGGVSDMWLFRRDKDLTSGFPKPIRINGRKFRRLSELRAWIDAKARESTSALDRPGEPRRAA